MSTIAKELEDLAPTMSSSIEDDIDVVPDDDDIDLDDIDSDMDDEMFDESAKDGLDEWEQDDDVAGKRKRPKRERSSRRRKKSPAVVKKDPATVFAEGKKSLGDAEPPKYDISSRYKVGDPLKHPKFGFGIVFAIMSMTKVEVVFEDGELRRLVCNLPDD